MKTNTQDLTKGYKGYNSDFTCNPYGISYQYAENTIHELPKGEKLECCKIGFHYCVNPLDVLNFYKLIGDNGELNILTRVEALGNIDYKGVKRITDKIKIEKKLSVNEYVDECIEYMKENCECEDGDDLKIATSNDYFQVATSGNYSQIATSGYLSQIATSGEYSQIATSGEYSRLATSGKCSQIAVSGDGSQVATSGYYSKIVTSGDSSQVTTNGHGSQIATSGDCSRISTSGDYSHTVTSGDYSSVNIQGSQSSGANMGINGKIKGVLGTWITLAEYDKYRAIKCIKSAKIDGEKLKENTWYKLENGEFIPIKDTL